MMIQRWASPSSKLLGATFFALLLALLVIWISTERHWYGMTLAGTATGDVQLLTLSHADIKNQQPLPLPMQLLSISQDNITFLLHADDVIEEPDVFDQFSTLEKFRKRQQILADLMKGNHLSLTLVDANQQQQTITVPAQSHRPLSSLPFSFWVQILTGIGGFIIGSWVLALRPRDAAARCFMLTGIGLMTAAFSAAIYSTRELALPNELIQWLMWLNHSGSIGFGFALMALFLFFPQQLISTRWIICIVACYLCWLLVELTEVISSPHVIMYLPILILSGLILILIAVQWRKSRGKPQALAALRWVGLVTLVTICCFLFLAAFPALFNIKPLVSQGYAFGFFLILYTGLAFGLKRYRLFELDRWAYYVLLWVLAGIALVGLDLLLLTFLHWQQNTSLLTSLLLCGFIYLPLRGWLWQRLVERAQPDSRSLFNHIIEISLAPSKEHYIERWQSLLNQTFTPLHIETSTGNAQAELSNDGQSLYIPAILHAPAMTLVLAEKGRRLFLPSDLKLIMEIIDMLAYVNENRQAFQQGAQQERMRIAQDLHDDLGSRLLTGLHQPRLVDVHDTISVALTEMRSIVRGLAGENLSLEQLFAELREETFVRCEGSGIELQWPIPSFNRMPILDYYTYRHLLSIIRELFSNIIRHANASHITVDIQLPSSELLFYIYNNGKSFDGNGVGGRGLINLYNRTQQLGGTLVFELETTGTITRLTTPLISAELTE